MVSHHIALVASGLAVIGMGCSAGAIHRAVPYRPVPVGDSPAEIEQAAKVKAENVAADNGVGIRYYRSSPYLLVAANGLGELNWQIVHLPDQTRKMSVEPYVNGATLNISLTFKNGMLVESTETADSTAVAIAIGDAVAQLAGTFAKSIVADVAAGPEGPKVQEIPPPRLYKILINGNTLELRGGPGDAPVFATIVPPKPAEKE